MYHTKERSSKMKKVKKVGWLIAVIFLILGNMAYASHVFDGMHDFSFYLMLQGINFLLLILYLLIIRDKLNAKDDEANKS